MLLHYSFHAWYNSENLSATIEVRESEAPKLGGSLTYSTSLYLLSLLSHLVLCDIQLSSVPGGTSFVAVSVGFQVTS